MGRPSRASQLQVITLKLKENLCANCTTPFVKETTENEGSSIDRSNNTQKEENSVKISSLLSLSCNRHEQIQSPPSSEEQKETTKTLAEALLTVFEASLKINKFTIPTSETVYMCPKCAKVLSQLYSIYKEFLELSNRESYVRAVIKNCLLWTEEQGNNILLPAASETNVTSLSPKKGVKQSQDFPDEDDEEEEFELYDDPLDEDYYPEITLTEPKSENESDAGSPIPKGSKPKRRKQSMPKRRQFSESVVASKNSTIPGKRSRVPSKRSVKASRKQPPASKSSDKVSKKTKSLPLRSSARVRKSQRKIAYKKKTEKLSKTIAKSGSNTLCQVCGKIFPSVIMLKRHSMTQHQKNKSPSCKYCGKKFSVVLLRDRHVRIFHAKESKSKTKNFSCKECGKVFKNRTFLRRHASVHSTERPFKCEICGKSFKRQDTLQEHQRGKLHAAVDTPKSKGKGAKTEYPCKKCNMIFKYKASLFRHESKVHSEDRPFACDKCWKRYKDEEKLFAHQKSAHENPKVKEPKIFKCEMCEKTYTYLYSYKAHVRNHTIAKPFLCSQCGKSFPQKQGFLRHMSTMHKGEQKHTCEVCGKSFKRKDHLNQHLRGKTHGRPLKGQPQEAPLSITTSANNFNRLVEPMSTNNNGLGQMLRPGVIIPANLVDAATHGEDRLVGQPSFTFSASNLFFDF